MNEITASRGRRAVFFDRDGVLNELVPRNGTMASPQRADHFRIVPDAAQLVEGVRHLGFLAFMFTNQPDIARGKLSLRDLELMTVRLRDAVPLDDVMICPHDDPDGCACRKPKPGMLFSLSDRWGADLKHSFIVGDSWKDIEAGRRAGCTTILIAGTERNEEAPRSTPDITVPSLAAAISWITKRA